tara:strand:+ start:1646 stop:2044 length:399 start_codon:yes stop_codon:yes gene_type:complete
MELGTLNMSGKAQTKLYRSMLALVVFLTACSDSPNARNQQIITDAIKQRLKDPDSLTLKNWRFSKVAKDTLQHACVEFNAKNSFGGYGEPSLAIARFYKGSWTITDLNGSIYDCEKRIAKTNNAAEFYAEGG